MKKLLILFVALALVFAFAACAQNADPGTTNPDASDAADPAADTDDTDADTADTNTDTTPANAEIVIKFGHVDGTTSLLDTPLHAFFEAFKTTVESASSGRMTAVEYGNSQLGGATSLFEQNAAGTLEMSIGFSMSSLSAYVAEAMLWDMPYVFSSELTAQTMLNEHGAALADQVAATTNVRPYFTAVAMRSFCTTKKQITDAASFKGLKLRVQDSPAMVAMLNSLGATATVVAYTETYSALQTGVVDGAEQHPYGLPMASWQEVVKYYTLDKYIPNISVCAVSETWFQSLTPADQAIVEFGIKQGQAAYYGVVKANESNVMQQVLAAGVTVYTPTAAELESIKSIAQPAVAEYVASQVGQEAVDEFLAQAQEIEANRGY